MIEYSGAKDYQHWSPIFEEKDTFARRHHVTSFVDSTYYQIKRFSAYGNLECKGLFVVDNNSFRIEESFEFTYLSHCSLCTVLQNDKKFKFSLHENQNV